MNVLETLPGSNAHSVQVTILLISFFLHLHQSSATNRTFFSAQREKLPRFRCSEILHLPNRVFDEDHIFSPSLPAL